MSNRTRASIMKNYDVSVSNMIAKEKNISIMDAFRMFIASETHRMLEDNDLRMWYFSELAIYDMWEKEVCTGSPQNSLYLRGDEVE